MAGRVLKKENYFHKCGFCKVFTASDRMQSGYAWHSHDFALEEVLCETEQRESACGELGLMSVLYILQGSKVRLPCFRFQQQSRRRVERIMNEMLEEYEQGALYYQEVLRIKIRELLLLFMREFATSPSCFDSSKSTPGYSPMSLS